MTSISQALALYDTAARIDRLRIELRALPPAPTIPHISTVSALTHTLAEITIDVNEHFNGDLHSLEAKKAVEAYSGALAPAGEAMMEIGRMQAEIAFFNFTTHPLHRDSPPGLKRCRQQANEIITGSCDAADALLESAADVLREAATRLAPPPARLQAAERARSPHVSAGEQTHTAPANPPPPAATATAPRTAKSR
ncbi:hypothetical protein [Streptomyces phytophilus]|uniref:hypothetical protein n=1 Tax=Streptomyces phytophilus TaxID=722715 RepID=UPI0015F0D7F5|nr:hypothetical protein [Streptomyces phytophilus]